MMPVSRMAAAIVTRTATGAHSAVATNTASAGRAGARLAEATTSSIRIVFNCRASAVAPGCAKRANACVRSLTSSGAISISFSRSASATTAVSTTAASAPISRYASSRNALTRCRLEDYWRGLEDYITLAFTFALTTLAIAFALSFTTLAITFALSFTTLAIGFTFALLALGESNTDT